MKKEDKEKIISVLRRIYQRRILGSHKEIPFETWVRNTMEKIINDK